MTAPEHRALVGANVRRRRLALGLTQASAAPLLGLHPNTLARVERGEMGLSLEVAVRVARGLGTELAWLASAQGAG